MKLFGSTCLFKTCRSERGSLLILVLSSLVVLSLLAFSVGYTVRQKLQAVTRLENRSQLRLAGEAALQQALEVLLEYTGEQSSVSFHALNQSWSRNASAFKNREWGQVATSILADGDGDSKEPAYGLTDEDRKINLNSARPEVLQNLLMITGGVEREDARRIVAAIRDWRDGDDDITDGGAESKDYQRLKVPYKAQNAPFNTLKELLWVQGMTPAIYARIEPYLTLEGKRVNLNTASVPVLRAMGLDKKITDQIKAFRAGKDRVEGTSDDGVFNELDQAAQTLTRYHYLDADEQKNLEKILSSGFAVRSEFFSARISAQMKSGKARIQIFSVINQRGEVMRWFEEFV